MRHQAERYDGGRAQVVRNGKASTRQLVTGSGTAGDGRRKVSGSGLLALVRAGVCFVDGVREKRKTTTVETKEKVA